MSDEKKTTTSNDPEIYAEYAAELERKGVAIRQQRPEDKNA